MLTPSPEAIRKMEKCLRRVSRCKIRQNQANQARNQGLGRAGISRAIKINQVALEKGVILVIAIVNQVCSDVIRISSVTTVFGTVARCRPGFAERTCHLHDFNEAIRPHTPNRLHVSSSRRAPIGFVEHERIGRFLLRGLVERWFEGDLIGSTTGFDHPDDNSADLIEF
jgi:hypothetical protein